MKTGLVRLGLFTCLLFPTSFVWGQYNVPALLDSLDKYLAEKYIPGAMISLVQADTILFAGGIGYAHAETGEKVTGEHLFRLGSVSKSFTALALLKLLHESDYSLETPIAEIDPDIPFTNEWEQQHPVRVAHLLEHTSGFEDFHLHAIYNVRDSLQPPLIDMVEDHQQSLHSRWQPGTRKAYSNPNYILAGHLVEVISGQPFAQYVQQNLLVPLGMKSSGYHFRKPADKLFATGHQRVGTTLNTLPFTHINGTPAGDFCSNAQDMARFLQLMLRRDSSLFSEQEYERIEYPQTSLAAKCGLQSGYGLGNYTIWKNGFLFHGHGGQIEGFTSRYLYSRKANLGISIAINRNGDANAVMDETLRLLLGNNEEWKQDWQTYPIPESVKDQFTGFYEFKSPKSELIGFSDRMLAGLKLDFQGDKLITRTILGKARDTLFYAGNNLFYRQNEGVPSILLIDKEGTKPVLWINDNYTERESRAKRIIIFFGLLFSFLFLLSFTLYGLVWLIRNGLQKERKNPWNHLTLLGVASSLILMFTGFGMTMANTKAYNGISFSSVLLYVSSFALLAFVLGSVYRCFKLTGKRRFKVFFMLTSLGSLAIALYLWDIGFIGLRLWDY